MKKELTSKFIPESINNKIVPGIMSDPKRLEEIEKRITENTQEKFKEYAEMHRRAYAESYRRVLD